MGLTKLDQLQGETYFVAPELMRCNGSGEVGLIARHLAVFTQGTSYGCNGSGEVGSIASYDGGICTRTVKTTTRIKENTRKN